MAAPAVAVAQKPSVAPSTILVKNHTKGIRVIGSNTNTYGLKMEPGWNVVPLKEWTEAKQIASIREELKASRAAPAIYTEKEFPAGAVDDLKAFEEEDAVDLAREAARPDVLERWALGEDRKPVLAAIHERRKEFAARK